MNIKELLLIVTLALVTTWGIEYLFFNKSKQVGLQSGQSFVVPESQQAVLKPLNTEIDFIDGKRPAPAVHTEVETDYARLVFSTDGASLERLEFKRELGGVPQPLNTIFPLAATEREKRCFLVALPEKTPYFYTFIDQKNVGDDVEITYQAETDAVILKKTFTVYKHTHQLGLTLTVTPKNGALEQQPRIFYPSPILPDIAATDVKSAVISDESGSIIKIPYAKISSNKGWFTPTLVGADDRYFIHVMAKDPAQFTQRAYFKVEGAQEIYSILEGPAVAQEQSWNMSFYFGPKEEKALAEVDPRLKQTLDYAGWLFPISNLLLKILIFFYTYLHNYGLAIIALTILIKLLLLPLTIKGAQGMKKTSEMQRKLQYIQQKYKDDPAMLAAERAELIRKHGMPGMAGCLPLLLQIPIFIALSRILSSAIELYKAPFTFWITDLSAADPYYVLPILIGVAMLLQATTVEQKQRMQFIVMAFVFGALSISFSAGLCLYIFMSTFLGIVQTAIQNKLKLA